MKTFVSLLIFLVSAQAFASTAQVASAYQYGGVTGGSSPSTAQGVLTIPEGTQASAGNAPTAKTLVASSATTTANAYYGFYDSAAAANTVYSASGGRKFYVSQICTWTASASYSGSTFGIGTATSLVANPLNTASTTAPTGAAYWFGGGAVNATPGGAFPNLDANTNFHCLNMPFVVNTTLIPFLQMGYASSFFVTMMGVEK